MRPIQLLGGLLALLSTDVSTAIRESPSVALARRPPLFGVRDSSDLSSPLASAVVPANDGAPLPRGGGCDDSSPILFLKVALSAGAETGLLYALASLAIDLNSKELSTFVKRGLQAATLFAIVFGSAAIGSILDRGMSAATMQVLDPNTVPGDEDWYANLKKPSWNPPGWLFPIMWLIVSKPTQYAALLRLLLKSYSKSDLAVPLLTYCAHLSLGDAWNKVFFGLECTGRGLVVIFTFWAALWTSAYLFSGVDEVAGLLIVPTGLWVTVAAALNGSIYLLNRGNEGCQ